MTVHLMQTELFVLEGGANVWVRDRWGKTAHEEACRVGATSVAEFLAAEMEKCPENSTTGLSG